MKTNTKVELPGKKQLSVTFIPNSENQSANPGLQTTVDVSQLQGVLSNFMSSSGTQLTSTVVTNGALPSEITEAVASLGTGVGEQPHEVTDGNIMQTAVDSLNLTDMDDNVMDQTENDDNDNDEENDEEESQNKGPTSAKSETVKVDGLLYDGMQFLLTYTQENSSRWSCAEKGCRASVNTTPLPNKYTVESLVTPTVLCATPHDISCHREGINKVKEEDMRKVNGFVGIGKCTITLLN